MCILIISYVPGSSLEDVSLKKSDKVLALLELLVCLGKIDNKQIYKHLDKKMIRYWQVLRGELKQVIEYRQGGCY